MVNILSTTGVYKGAAPEMFQLVPSVTVLFRKDQRQLGTYFYRIFIVTAIRSMPSNFVNQIFIFSTCSDRTPLFANQ